MTGHHPIALPTAPDADPVKLAFITPGFSASDDDDCIPALLTLVRRLVARGACVHVFALRYPARTDRYTVSGATVHPLGVGTRGGLARPPLLARAVASIVAEHVRGSFDGLHAIWGDEPGFVAAVAGRLIRRPSVITLFGGELVDLPSIDYGAQRSRLSRLLVRAALRGGTHVAAGSSHLARLAAAHVEEERLVRFAIGVDAAVFQPPATGRHDQPRLPGEPSLLHAAGLVPVKDQRTLLAAIDVARRDLPGLHLHLVGDGPLRGALEAQVAALKLGEHVTFHGSHRFTEMPSFYRRVDACVQSSVHEGQQLVILEAAGCARVTIGTRVGLLGDLAPPAATAAPGDVAALAEAIVRSSTPPARLQALGERARDRFLKGYTVDHTGDHLFELLR
jgi:colanic acid/amylovoran biosynthesis glycosyltransferase